MGRYVRMLFAFSPLFGMKYSQLFGKTRLSAPHDAKSVNAQLLTQAGFIDQMAAGIYNILPLGWRVLNKINNIIRDEMNNVGGQELLMPALHPEELWEKTGRTRTMDDVLYRTQASGNKDFNFGPSHEEAVTPLAAKFVQSYKDLPFAVYQIQTKFRDEPRAKSGLLRGREFGMKDMYSFHRDEKDLDAYYEKVKDAYLNVYERCELKAYVVEASGGAFSDKFSHEYSVVTPAGEDTIIINNKTGEAQNMEIAEGKIVDPADPQEDELPMEEVTVNRDVSVEANAKAHDVEPWRILKTVVYNVDIDGDGDTDDGFLGVVIRGDLQINQHKLERYLGKAVRSASPAELKKLGLVQGFISPVGQKALRFIGDHSIKHVKNFITGANVLNKDLKNVNIGRDFVLDDFTDVVLLDESSLGGGDHTVEKAIEAGNIFKLGTKFSEDFGLKYTDDKGKEQTVVMGCYGIGNTRLMGTIVEASHDDDGIIWPKSVAPFLAHLVSLGNDDVVDEAAAKLYEDLQARGVEVLYDDRPESAGKKLKDADLIGIPLRLVVSKRTLEQDSVEWKIRSETDASQVKLSDVVSKVIEFSQ